MWPVIKLLFLKNATVGCTSDPHVTVPPRKLKIVTSGRSSGITVARPVCMTVAKGCSAGGVVKIILEAERDGEGLTRGGEESGSD